VDRPVDPAAAEERGVRRVHDRVDLLLRDVTADDVDHVSTVDLAAYGP